MAYDASIKFHLVPDIFVFIFSTSYSPQQYTGMCHACHLPSKIVSLVISALCKQPFEVGMSLVKIISRSIATGCPSAPKCRCTTCLRTRRTPLSRFFRCLIKGSITDTTPHGCPVSRQTRLLWSGVLISENRLLEGRRDPRKQLGSHSQDLYKHLSCMLCHYDFQDPSHGVIRHSLWVL